jgi:hypothetical protein
MQFQTIITSRHQPQPSYYANPIPKINRAIYSLFALDFRVFDNLIQPQKLTEQFTRYLLSNTGYRGKNTRRPGSKTTRYPPLRNRPTMSDC